MVPSLNPLETPTVLCPSCGNLCPPEPICEDNKGRKINKVTEVRYFCVNPEKDCNWEVRAALRHCMGEGPYKMKPEEVERRREEAEQSCRYREIRENAISELIALLPRLKDLVFRLPESGGSKINPARSQEGKQLKEQVPA